MTSEPLPSYPYIDELPSGSDSPPNVTAQTNLDGTTDLVLSWQPLSSTPGPGRPEREALLASDLSDEPPSYTASRPTSPITYTLTQEANSTMLVRPPDDSADPRPLYHISVNMNCLVPQSFITTVRRGSSDDGPVLGDFEIGGPKSYSMVCIRDHDFPLRDIMSQTGDKKYSAHWKWNLYGKVHRWVNEGRKEVLEVDGVLVTVVPALKCTSKNYQAHYATFYPATGIRRPHRPRTPARLVLEPAGWDMQDDILMSCLMAERQRSLLLD